MIERGLRQFIVRGYVVVVHGIHPIVTGPRPTVVLIALGVGLPRNQKDFSDAKARHRRVAHELIAPPAPYLHFVPAPAPVHLPGVAAALRVVLNVHPAGSIAAVDGTQLHFHAIDGCEVVSPNVHRGRVVLVPL